MAEILVDGFFAWSEGSQLSGGYHATIGIQYGEEGPILRANIGTECAFDLLEDAYRAASFAVNSIESISESGVICFRDGSSIQAWR